MNSPCTASILRCGKGLGFREGTAFSRADKATGWATARLKAVPSRSLFRQKKPGKKWTPDYSDEPKGMGLADR
jgi:hypothetical protein